MLYITNSEKQTFALAKKIAKKLKGGEIIGLTGELGAGKTIFSKGLAAGLGIKKNINSPTFVLMKIYKIKNNKTGIKNFVHIDAYRLKGPKNIISLGIQEYFNQPDTVTAIEWADKIEKALLKGVKFVKLKNKGENKRYIKTNLI